MKVLIEGKEYDISEAIKNRIINAAKKNENDEIRLQEAEEGKLIKIGPWMIEVLKQKVDGNTEIICKDSICDPVVFGETNDYNGCVVDEICKLFAETLSEIIGEENVLEHDVDLTTEDGLKDYGVVRRKASVLTMDRYRQYAELLNQYRFSDLWWLATGITTKRHGSDKQVKCVTQKRYLSGDRFICDEKEMNVHPFCVVKGSVVVKKARWRKAWKNNEGVEQS